MWLIVKLKNNEKMLKVSRELNPGHGIYNLQNFIILFINKFL